MSFDTIKNELFNSNVDHSSTELKIIEKFYSYHQGSAEDAVKASNAIFGRLLNEEDASSKFISVETYNNFKHDIQSYFHEHPRSMNDVWKDFFDKDGLISICHKYGQTLSNYTEDTANCSYLARLQIVDDYLNTIYLLT